MTEPLRITFILASGVQAYAGILQDRPLGGTETGLVLLAEALSKLGCEVTVITPHPNPPLSKPLYLPHRALDDLAETDILVAVREWMPLFVNLKAKKRLLWTGDAFDQVMTVGIGDKRVTQAIDSLLTVSNWHRDTLTATSGFPFAKTFVLRNGIDCSLFSGTENRSRKRLIYSSTPYRGLTFLVPIFKKLKEAHSDCELHVFSGFTVYAGAGGQEEMKRTYEPLMRELRSLSGCHVHGNCKQSELAREFMKSSILAYPNTFAETSCITAMEAQAAGCVVVTSDRGALPETVGDAGVLISGDPSTEEYQAKFITAVDSLFKNDDYWSALSKKSIEQSRERDWANVAERFISHSKSLFSGS